MVRNRLQNFARKDALGNHQSVTDPSGNTTSSDFDSAGNVIQITDANQEVGSFSFDSGNRLLTQTNPLGHVTQRECDLLGYSRYARIRSLSYREGAAPSQCFS